MKRILFVLLMLISSLGIVAQVRYDVSFQTFGNYSFSGAKVYIESAKVLNVVKEVPIVST